MISFHWNISLCWDISSCWNILACWNFLISPHWSISVYWNTSSKWNIFTLWNISWCWHIYIYRFVHWLLSSPNVLQNDNPFGYSPYRLSVASAVLTCDQIIFYTPPDFSRVLLLLLSVSASWSSKFAMAYFTLFIHTNPLWNFLYTFVET